MKQRIVTGLIGGVAFLLLVYVGKEWYSLLVLTLAILGLFEFLRMAGIAPFGFAGVLGYLLMVSIMWPDLYFSTWVHLRVPDLLLPVTLLLLMYSVIRKNQFHIEHAALTLIGALYIGCGFSYMAATRNIPDVGLHLTILALLGIWASDSGAYFVGKAIGKRKLWPAISPNKTVEGSIGGFIIATVIVLGVNAWLGTFPLTKALAIAAVAGAAGQMGDLIESAFKRHFDVKDSGHIIPGHGGVLDRVDSWILVFPVLHLLGIV
ncbi:phosphatidate cytidylyltransferase [Brevibacillus sp. H7]|uniref:phosphatidate cytidylyltransferase n=1 Tax=Brevibacillus sp. H7 TaxID=3349138 RepID=UPI0038192CA2